jgi:biotin carboxyl carrier protein
VTSPSRAWAFREEIAVLRGDGGGAGASLEAPMPGNVLVVNVTEGEPVARGDVLVVLESMKMELAVAAPSDGVVGEVAVRAGDRVALGQVLVAVEPREDA